MDFLKHKSAIAVARCVVGLHCFSLAIVGGALWFGWVWGKAEQSSLQAEADLGDIRK